MSELFRKDIVIDLNDPKTIDDAIDAVNKLRNEIPKALDRICKFLCEKGVKIARQKLGEFGISEGGDLYNSIRFELEGGGKGIGYVIAGRPDDHMSDNPKWTKYSYAVFVEYGFGTVNYYDTAGQLVTTQSRIDRRKEIGESPTSGRGRDHPSGNYRYRDAEDYKVIKGSDGTEFFGWKYFDRKENRWRVSYGQNPKPFMYRTLLELTSIAERDVGGRLALYLYSSL